uniref:hypothetical protein n=1 Tax=Pedobacter schmidteae TaxID=2201271 RepID=UPI000EB13988|nr:hypothetical protein [Pedobacter schmidteae]
MKKNILQLGHKFYELDREKATLAEFGNPANHLALAELKPDGPGYVYVDYDPGRKRIEPAESPEITDDSKTRIIIPYVTLQEGFENDQKLIDLFNTTSKLNNWNLAFISNDYYNRLNGELPVVDVHGEPFKVNTDYLLLADDYGREINIRGVAAEDGRYHIDVYLGDELNPEPVRASVPQFVKTDPVGICQKYEMNWNELPERDSDLRSNPQNLELRAEGKLPTLGIGNDVFIVDVNNDELRYKDLPITIANLENLPLDENGWNHQIYYNEKTKEPVEISEDTTELPKDVVMVTFPQSMALDPYGYEQLNEMHGHDLNYYNKFYPIRSHTMAQITRIEDSPLKELVERNLKAREQHKNADNKQRHTNERKKKRGLGH